MNEVQYKDATAAAVRLFEACKDKKASDWENTDYGTVRKFIKDHYLKEQDFTCCFCRQRIVVSNGRAWDVEHIIARSLRPEFMFTPRNLCVACIDCNSEKGDSNVVSKSSYTKFPQSSSAYKTFHPHFDKIEEHIKVLVPGLVYFPISNKGRSTVRVYGLDRFHLNTGRTNILSRNDSIRSLMIAALANDANYEARERILLEALIMKRRDVLGSETCLDVLSAIKEAE